MLTVACPSCSHAIEIPDLGADATLRCPACGKETAASGTQGGEVTAETLPPPQTRPPQDDAGAADPESLPTVPPGGLSAGAAIPQGYEILGEIGRGGMGVVYKARQVALSRVVALKMLLHAGHTEREGFGRFRTEAESLARLKHPGIVTIHEVGEVYGLPFFAMEWCEGGSLDRKLAGKPLPPREAASLVQQLSRAVQAAHDAKVLHRDLKPANVLLSADGTPKVSDFGLAKKLDEKGHTRTGTVMGTPEYVPPEQAAGSKEVGVTADVYSLGAILYECLTGRPPFRAATAAETLMQVLNEEPVAPRSLNAAVPRELETITLKCLSKEPARRYASATELGDDLGRSLAGEPIRCHQTKKQLRITVLLSGDMAYTHDIKDGLTTRLIEYEQRSAYEIGFFPRTGPRGAVEADKWEPHLRAVETRAGIAPFDYVVTIGTQASVAWRDFKGAEFGKVPTVFLGVTYPLEEQLVFELINRKEAEQVTGVSSGEALSLIARRILALFPGRKVIFVYHTAAPQDCRAGELLARDKRLDRTRLVIRGTSTFPTAADFADESAVYFGWYTIEQMFEMHENIELLSRRLVVATTRRNIVDRLTCLAVCPDDREIGRMGAEVIINHLTTGRPLGEVSVTSPNTYVWIDWPAVKDRGLHFDEAVLRHRQTRLLE